MRVTIQRLPYRKLVSQLTKREEHAATKKMLSETKVTQNPKQDAILWDPDPSLCKALVEILEREQTFARKRDSANFKMIEANIARLRKASESTAQAPG